MRPTELEDTRELLEQALLERDEEQAREHVLNCMVDLLDPANEPEEREWYRYELSVLRKHERRLQKLNRTELVLDAPTYDREAGDDLAEISDWDLYRLRWLGIKFPVEACKVTPLPVREYARRAFWEGFDPI